MIFFIGKVATPAAILSLSLSPLYRCCLSFCATKKVIIYCVNDGAVMSAWSDNQGVKSESIVTMMGDPSLQLTEALDMVLDHPGPMAVLGYRRSKRFALFIDDGEVKVVRVSERGPLGEEDPAGDAFPEATTAPEMIKAIDALSGQVAAPPPCTAPWRPSQLIATDNTSLARLPPASTVDPALALPPVCLLHCRLFRSCRHCILSAHQ